jgi:hypothetical protein
MLPIFFIRRFLLAFEKFPKDAVNNKLGPGLRHYLKLFRVRSAVGYVDYHFCVAITRESAVLHVVHASAAEFFQRRGSLRILFLKFPGNLIHRQGKVLNGSRGISSAELLGKQLAES